MCYDDIFFVTDTCAHIALQEEENAEAVNMEEDDSMSDLRSLKYDNLDSVSKLQKTQFYNVIMQVSDLTLATPFVACHNILCLTHFWLTE
jgi:hypothetical protein